MEPPQGSPLQIELKTDEDSSYFPNKNTSNKSSEISLSRYFPGETVYFYAFPAGEASNFFNKVPPWVEELVAARTLLCAGDQIKIVVFAASQQNRVWELLEQECGVKLIDKSHVIFLDDQITSEVLGQERNEKIKANLLRQGFNKTLVMAQPFLDEELKGLYQIDPELVNWINNKENLSEYVPSENLPLTYFTFENGEEFTTSKNDIPLPCVVKVSSSSSGDGVRVCYNIKDLNEAKEVFGKVGGKVHIEEYIEVEKNFCIQFAIPFESSKKIEIIGYNEQVIAKNGEFLGGVVNPWKEQSMSQIHQVLTEKILPYIRSLGWYGVGGFDVLVDANGGFYFVDPNFRTTATFAFVCQTLNGKIKKPNLSFSGKFQGPEEEFKRNILSLSGQGTEHQIMDIVSLTRAPNIEEYRFNAAVLFENGEELQKNAKKLLSLGVTAGTLQRIADENTYFKI